MDIYPRGTASFPAGMLVVRVCGMEQCRLGHVKYRRCSWQPTPVFLPGESQGRGSLLRQDSRKLCLMVSFFFIFSLVLEAVLSVY